MQKYACSRGITLTVQSNGPCQGFEGLEGLNMLNKYGEGSDSNEEGSDSSEEDETPVKPGPGLPTMQPCK